MDWFYESRRYFSSEQIWLDLRSVLISISDSGGRSDHMYLLSGMYSKFESKFKPISCNFKILSISSKFDGPTQGYTDQLVRFRTEWVPWVHRAGARAPSFQRTITSILRKSNTNAHLFRLNAQSGVREWQGAKIERQSAPRTPRALHCGLSTCLCLVSILAKMNLGVFIVCKTQECGARHFSWCSSHGATGLGGGGALGEGIKLKSSTRLSRGHEIEGGHEGGTSHPRKDLWKDVKQILTGH